jgi:hypothetical protein
VGCGARGQGRGGVERPPRQTDVGANLFRKHNMPAKPTPPPPARKRHAFTSPTDANVSPASLMLLGVPGATRTRASILKALTGKRVKRDDAELARQTPAPLKQARHDQPARSAPVTKSPADANLSPVSRALLGVHGRQKAREQVLKETAARRRAKDSKPATPSTLSKRFGDVAKTPLQEVHNNVPPASGPKSVRAPASRTPLAAAALLVQLDV